MSKVVQLFVSFFICGCSLSAADSAAERAVSVRDWAERTLVQCKKDYLRLVFYRSSAVQAQNDRLLVMQHALADGEFEFFKILFLEFSLAQLAAVNAVDPLPKELFLNVIKKATALVTAYLQSQEDAGLRAQALSAWHMALVALAVGVDEEVVKLLLAKLQKEWHYYPAAFLSQEHSASVL